MKLGNYAWLALAVVSTGYGSGAYGSGAYGQAALQIGPITLPVTGSTWIVFVVVGVAAIGIGLLRWTRQLKAKKTTAKGE